jgi:parallel beta-helix repeat protein
VYSCAEKLTIKNLKITEFWCGIELEYSSDNCIFENEITGNKQGVWIHQSSNDTISGNIISGNEKGITLTASHDKIRGNSILANSECGIKICWSFNSISGNSIENNRYGVTFDYSSHNVFTNNNFINNTHQVDFEHSLAGDVDQTIIEGASVNGWDDCEKGNYWSDYQIRYPNAAELDEVGTWNTPYVINENNQDNYPLVEPVKISDNPQLLITLLLLAIVPTVAVIALCVEVYRETKKN